MEPAVQKGSTVRTIPKSTKKLLELSFTHKDDPQKMKEIIQDFFNDSIEEMDERVRQPGNLLHVARKNEELEKTFKEIVEDGDISISGLAVSLFPIGSGSSPQVVYTRPQRAMIKDNEDLTIKILKVLRIERNRSLYRDNFNLYRKAFEPRAGDEEKILRALEVNLAQKRDKTMRVIIMDAYCTAVLEKQERGRFRFAPMNLFEMRKTFNSIQRFDTLKEFHETWLKHTKDAGEQTLHTDHGQKKSIAEILAANIEKLPLTGPEKKRKSRPEAIPETEVSNDTEKKSDPLPERPVKRRKSRPEAILETEVSKDAEKKSDPPPEEAKAILDDSQKGADAQEIARDAPEEAKAILDASQKGADAQEIARDAPEEAKAILDASQKGADAQEIARDAPGEEKADPEDSQVGADAQGIATDTQPVEDANTQAQLDNPTRPKRLIRLHSRALTDEYPGFEDFKGTESELTEMVRWYIPQLRGASLEKCARLAEGLNAFSIKHYSLSKREVDRILPMIIRRSIDAGAGKYNRKQLRRTVNEWFSIWLCPKIDIQKSWIAIFDGEKTGRKHSSKTIDKLCLKLTSSFPILSSYRHTVFKDFPDVENLETKQQQKILKFWANTKMRSIKDEATPVHDRIQKLAEFFSQVVHVIERKNPKQLFEDPLTKMVRCYIVSSTFVHNEGQSHLRYPQKEHYRLLGALPTVNTELPLSLALTTIFESSNLRSDNTQDYGIKKIMNFIMNLNQEDDNAKEDTACEVTCIFDPDYEPVGAKHKKISPVAKPDKSKRSETTAKVKVPMSDVKSGHSEAMGKKKLEHVGDDLATKVKKSKSTDSAAKVGVAMPVDDDSAAKIAPPKPVDDDSAAKIVPPKPVEDYSSAKVKVRKHRRDATDKDKSSRKKRKQSESSEERDSFTKRMEQNGQMLLARMEAIKERNALKRQKNAE
jgi:hypothetical protein